MKKVLLICIVALFSIPFFQFNCSAFEDFKYEIDVHIKNCQLHLFKKSSRSRELERTYEIASPSPYKYSPHGKAVVTSIIFEPYWYPTRKQRLKKPSLLEKYPPGHPENAMGARKIILDFENLKPDEDLYRIHGTNKPQSIGKRVSGGCIRMRNEDIIELSEIISEGTIVNFM